MATLARVAEPSPDAELIALGREYDALSIEIDRLRREFEQAEERWKKATTAWWAENPPMPLPADISEEERDLVRKERDAVVYKALTRIGAETESDPHPIRALWDRRDALTGRIAKARASTIEGLAVQARQAAQECLSRDDWEEPLGNLDWDKLSVRVLVENLCAAAGVDLRGRPVTKREA
ncbi:hypothetical protein JNW90_30755 [Micromonospora sp. STR1s_5]|nr:hypothetical protein [Micromonospora sp. STR1s_5]